MDALAADTGVGGLAALLERSALVINMVVDGMAESSSVYAYLFLR